MIGLLLPPSVGGALMNFAADDAGRIAVNLNYTASSEVIASCADQCDVETSHHLKSICRALPNLKFPAEKFSSKKSLQPRASPKSSSHFSLAFLIPAAARSGHRCKQLIKVRRR